MPPIHVPTPVNEVVDAINKGDTTAFLALFTPDAAVDDWGSVYSGPDEIAVWNARELIGGQRRLDIGSMELPQERTELRRVHGD